MVLCSGFEEIEHILIVLIERSMEWRSVDIEIAKLMSRVPPANNEPYGQTLTHHIINILGYWIENK